MTKDQQSKRHKNCDTCKMFEVDIQKQKDTIHNLESNFRLHTKKREFFKICPCHGYILYSKQGYDKHMKSVSAVVI